MSAAGHSAAPAAPLARPPCAALLVGGGGVTSPQAGGALAGRPGDTDTLSSADDQGRQQRALDVKADGVVGPKTKRAIRRCNQREHGLDVDGVAGTADAPFARVAR